MSDIFFLNNPFFCMLRLLAAKFSKSVNVPAERVEWILADTDNVEPDNTFVLVSNASSHHDRLAAKLDNL